MAAPSSEIIFHQVTPVSQAPSDSALVFGRAAKPPVLDGVIEAKEWAVAGRTLFDFKGDPTKKSEVFALYDDSSFYLAFRCAEPLASQVAPRNGPGKTGHNAVDKEGDCNAYEDDAIEIWISPDEQQKVVYQFIANTIQGHYDAKYQGLNADENYTSGFKSGAKVGTNEWTIEFAIPLKAVELDKVVPGQTTVRLNFGRDREVGANQTAGWQEFWGDQGKMPHGFFAPPIKVGIGAVQYGQRFLGDNTASFAVFPARRTTVSTGVVQGEHKTNGGAIGFEDGFQKAGYKIPRADLPFDLDLIIESDGKRVQLSEKGLAPVPPIAALVERTSVGAVDGPLTVFFRLNMVAASLKNYTLKAELVSEGKTLSETTAKATTSAGEVRFTLDAEQEAKCDIKLHLLDASQKPVISLAASTIQWTGKPKNLAAASGQIPLKLDVLKGVANAKGLWPVTVGVPFPKGAVASEANVRLLSPSGAEVPIEVGVPATWDRARSSMKWLHVKFLADLQDAGKNFVLEYGPNVKRAAGTSSMKADETNDSIVIDTGKIKLVVGKKPFRFINQAWLDRNGDAKYADDEQVIVTGDNSGLFIETMDGRRYSSGADLPWPEVEKVELESRGPLEAVIRAEGWHKATAKDQKPDRMMKYVVRIVAYAGQPMLRVFHSFILTEDYNTQYREVAFGVNLKNDETEMIGEQYDKAYPLTPGAEAALVQADHNAYRVQMRTPEVGPNILRCLQDGERSAGWLLLRRKDWGVTLATRDFWQNYCKSTAVRRDAITFSPWPRDAAREGRPLSFRPEDVIVPVFVSRLSYLSDGGRAEHGNYSNFTYGYGGIDAIGVSKTHEYILDFTPQPSIERSKLVQALLNDPPLAIIPPAYACATEVFGKIHPYDAEQFGVEETGLKAMLGRIEYGKPEDKHYGLVNFGESYQQSTETGRIYCYRTYQNAGYGIINDFYKGYLRSGDRDWFRYAVRRARHNRDVDQRHYGPMAGAQSEYEALNWALPAHITFWTHYFYLLEDWYMTGDRRSWDCYQETCNEIAKLNYTVAPRDERHWFNQPLELAHMYEATWNPKFLELAKTIVDGILLAKEQVGAGKWPPESVAKDEYLQPAFLAYHQLTKDPRVLKYLEDYFTEHKAREGYATGKAQDVAAYLYWQTADPKWLDVAGGAENMRNYMSVMDTKRPPPAGGMFYWTVNRVLKEWKDRPVKYKTVAVDTFLDKGYHHTWDRLWLFMSAVSDARKKGTLKPATEINQEWVGPIWNEEYWKSVTPEKAKEYGWTQ